MADKTTMAEGNGVLLSVALAGRNDNYLGDFKYRLSTAINYLCRNAALLGRLADIEVVVSDWNSESPLSRDLPLSDEARQVTRFIVIPPSVAAECKTGGRVFHDGYAFNAGIRRARGKYALVAPADSLFTRPSLGSLLRVLDGTESTAFDPARSFMAIGRKEVPWQFGETKPGLAEWNRFLQLHAPHLESMGFFRGICASHGGYVLHRDIWAECQGLFEGVYGWGFSDMEIGLRVNNRYPIIDLDFFGILIYDMQSKDDRPRHELMPPGWVCPSGISQGAEKWGLRDHSLAEERGEARLREGGAEVPRQPLDRTKAIAELSDPRLGRKIDLDLCVGLRDTDEKAILFPLVWYCQTFFPRKYLETGPSRGLAYGVASNAAPGLEIYLLEEFAGQYMPQMRAYTYNLAHAGHKGYVRFVPGDPASAFKRLVDAFPEKPAFDLVVFRTDLYGGGCVSRLTEIAGCLEDGGAIILTGKDRDQYQAACDYLAARFKGKLVVRSPELNVCLAVNADCSPAERPGDPALAGAWRISDLRMLAHALKMEFSREARKVKRQVGTTSDRVRYEQVKEMTKFNNIKTINELMRHPWFPHTAGQRFKALFYYAYARFKRRFLSWKP